MSEERIGRVTQEQFRKKLMLYLSEKDLTSNMRVTFNKEIKDNSTFQEEVLKLSQNCVKEAAEMNNIDYESFVKEKLEQSKICLPEDSVNKLFEEWKRTITCLSESNTESVGSTSQSTYFE